MAEKWTNIGSISSETSKGTKYGIDVNEDGTLLRCHCMSYIHSKDMPKSCKHVLSTEAGRLLQNYQVAKLPSSYHRIGNITATLMRHGDVYRQASYMTPTVILSKTDYDKLFTLVNAAKMACERDFYGLQSLRGVLRGMGIVV